MMLSSVETLATAIGLKADRPGCQIERTISGNMKLIERMQCSEFGSLGGISNNCYENEFDTVRLTAHRSL